MFYSLSLPYCWRITCAICVVNLPHCVSSSACPGRLQRFAQHQIAFLLGLLQYLRVELAADHGAAHVRQAFEQRFEDVETALAGTQALVAQHGERRKAVVDDGEGFLGGAAQRTVMPQVLIRLSQAEVTKGSSSTTRQAPRS